MRLRNGGLGMSLTGPDAEDLRQGFMIDGDDKVGAAKGQVPGLVKAIAYCKGISFDWGPRM